MKLLALITSLIITSQSVMAIEVLNSSIDVTKSIWETSNDFITEQTQATRELAGDPKRGPYFAVTMGALYTAALVDRNMSVTIAALASIMTTYSPKQAEALRADLNDFYSTGDKSVLLEKMIATHAKVRPQDNEEEAIESIGLFVDQLMK